MNSNQDEILIRMTVLTNLS